MSSQTIYVTEFDLQRLEEILTGKRYSSRLQTELDHLEEELSRCQVVSSEEVGSDIVTMNSRVRLRDVDSGKEMIYTLVFPWNADLAGGRISVASPIGTAILGYAAGDTIAWKVPGGTRRIRIEEILYQPEAAGDYHL